MTRALVVIAAVLLTSAHASTPAPAPSRPTVVLSQGTLRGITESGVQIFRGIPFAAPPVGEWRWRPPQPAPAWHGVRDASTFGAVCPQVLQAGYTQEELGKRPMSEDCLYLNIWSAEAGPSAKRPVMLWLLPGGFTKGDGGMSMYDGSALARRGVVVATFNYRLGIFGEFAHPALSHAQADEPLANYHLMDQIAAMRWVRANIAAFGGDPANVTIFGMSAGGMSVNYQMASPASVGLFDKAISESSALRMSMDRDLHEDRPGLPSLESEGAAIAAKLGVSGDEAAVVRGLRALTTAQLIEYQRNNRLGTGGGLNPVIDGRILVQPVGKAFVAGQQHHVPYLTGATSWEGSLVQGPNSIEPVLGLLNVSRGQADALYHEQNPQRLAVKLYTDFFFATQRYLARQHARTGSPTYVYHFSHVLEEHVGDYFGAAHGSETRYVFGTLDGLSKVAGPERPGVEGYRVSEADRGYSDTVARYWVQFAKTGDPNVDGLPGWPAVTPGNDVILEFGQQRPEVRRDFAKDRRVFFEEHFDAGRL